MLEKKNQNSLGLSSILMIITIIINHLNHILLFVKYVFISDHKYIFYYLSLYFFNLFC